MSVVEAPLPVEHEDKLALVETLSEVGALMLQRAELEARLVSRRAVLLRLARRVTNDGSLTDAEALKVAGSKAIEFARGAQRGHVGSS
jgi:hypothetical protein